MWLIFEAKDKASDVNPFHPLLATKIQKHDVTIVFILGLLRK